MGKITIKYYPNKDLKQVGGLYPLYVQVIYNRKVLKFKAPSTLFEYVDDSILDILYEKGFLNNCSHDIEYTINILENEKIPVTSKNVSKYSKSFWDIFDENFSKLIKAELPDAPKFLTDSPYLEIKKLFDFVGFEGYHNLLDMSDKLSIIESISMNLGIFRLNDKRYFLGIDFFGGEKLNDIIEEIQYYDIHNRDNEKYINDTINTFREFIDL